MLYRTVTYPVRGRSGTRTIVWKKEMINRMHKYNRFSNSEEMFSEDKFNNQVLEKISDDILDQCRC